MPYFVIPPKIELLNFHSFHSNFSWLLCGYLFRNTSPYTEAAMQLREKTELGMKDVPIVESGECEDITRSERPYLL
jgi:hypothetical protein